LARSHRYLPVGDDDREEMLSAIGVSSIEELFSSLPAEVRLADPPRIDGPLSDQEIRRRFAAFESSNRVAGRDVASFLGAGAYRHDVPAAVDHLIQRGEFLTVYTPYQPEVSQGTLQAIFEFQTFIALLTGLPVANASLYDGASAFAEAVLMAGRLARKRRKVVMSRGIHPHYRATLRTYAANLDLDLVEVGWDETGATDPRALGEAVDEATICVALQSPNYFGVVEPWRRAVDAAHARGALAVAVVAEALSLALLASPGEAGCDLACGEAQSFGLPLAFGGPYLGFLAARDEAKRAMPGRLVGETVDAQGRRAWVLTLATREQHIRREKATSNICTNVALCALAATLYLALHGRCGLARLAEINLQRTAALVRGLESPGAGLGRRFAAPFFNEVTLRAEGEVGELMEGLRQAGVLAGVPLAEDYPELADCFVAAVTEANPPQDLERFVREAERLAALRGVAVAAGPG
jgi:glycine dehydrogenase subunit 1